MGNYYKTVSDNGQGPVRTDENNDSAIDRLERHKEELLEAIANGWIVGAELVLTYLVNGDPYTAVTISRPPTESDADFVDRYIEAAVGAITTTPPS